MSNNPNIPKLPDLFSQTIQIPFEPVHRNENNEASQHHLEKHRTKFSHDCFEVLQQLVGGKRLTVRYAVQTGLSNSLPRRILDLKKMGVQISEKWVSDHKEWFMTSDDKAKLAEILLQKAEMKGV